VLHDLANAAKKPERESHMKFVHTADTHLGFEITKVSQEHPPGRKNRADAIFRNFLTVIDHAKTIEADLFVHSGDLFNKYYIPREILDELIRPLLDLERLGTRVLIIPGNHERSQFPFDLFHGAPGVHVFDEPKALTFHINGYTTCIAGFPFIRDHSRRLFDEALRETRYEGQRSDLNILITHQAFDQAVVGPNDFVFRPGRSDTVSRHTIPTDFDYVAAGHIHRYQILLHPLKPSLHFVYPGSIQRMSFAEMHEEKGFIEGEILHNRIETRFFPLPAYDMEMVQIEASGLSAADCEEAIKDQFWRFNEDLVIRFKLVGGERLKDYPDVDFQRLRAESPPVLDCQFALRTRQRWVMR
jgi:DNA repair exonuclease SbcCD nuclease subunit